METMIVSLKPCPFCGSEGVIEESVRYPYPEPIDYGVRAYSVLCSNESCIMHQSQKFYTEIESAKKAWNQRSQQNDKR